ncbi:MAG: ATP-binding protein [Bacteroidota bacterium]|nr:ATP-binding protein [Bacteroidota bacterium]
MEPPIIQLTNRAARIVRQLLAFSRRQIIEPAVIDINTLISDLLKLIGNTIGEHIEIEFLPNKGINTIFADTAQIEQIIMNLCMNARDAMPEGGKLIIETENVVLDEDYVHGYPGAKPGKYVMLAVTDTGCGIPSSSLDRIFEPFFTTKEKDKGTGLGLAMVHGIVYQHNGIINVYSEVSKGTTFKIYFLASEDATAIKIIDDKKELPIGTETILLVEDDADLREMIFSLLTNQGYVVITAIDGEQAIEIFTRNALNIDFIISDVVMPKISGKEFYNKVRLLNPDIGFLFISGYTANVIHKNFLLERGFDFLQKPFTPYELAIKIRKILEKPNKIVI